MPKVKSGESEQEYVSRAIPILKKEGLTDQQAKGKAYGMYRSQTEKNNEISIYRHQKKVYKYNDNRPPKDWWETVTKALERNPSVDDPKKVAGWLWFHKIKHSAKSVGGFESPEPGSLSKKGADMLARVYAEARKSGDDKETAAKKSWSAVSKAGYKNQAKSIEQKIFDFFANNPNPEDSKVHAFAESNNIEPSQLEEQIYKLISTFVSGGLSVGKADFPEDQMQKGLKIELEHVNKDSPYAEMIARKVSQDHLAEMPDYYDKLAIMEKGE